MDKFHFSGWATKNNIKCSDGRTIMKDAFKHCNGATVPLVWNHQHNDPVNVLGHALLENRENGVYAYCTLNDTDAGRNAKQLVEHGDVTALSIYANQLKQQGDNVLHGSIREVSLVLAGANPGAFIDSIIKHGEESDEEAVIYSGEEIELSHADSKEEAPTEAKKEDKPVADKKEKTVGEVFDELTEEQKTVVYAMIGQALEENKEADKKEGDDNMKHNVFEQDNTNNENVLSHSEMMSVIADAKKYGSMRESVLQHGITEIGTLFPTETLLNNTPGFYKRDTGWVANVMNGVHKTPFSKLKALFADITEEDARARGYIKGKQKKEEVFALLKRTTSPQTIYKLQKMDRDDIIDITDFDVVAFLKQEMRMMLDEEIARAILIGDGRLPDSDDKIKEEHIRPIWTDEELYAIHSPITVGVDATLSETAAEFIDQAVRAREEYTGSGSPVCFMAENLLSECLLLKDKNGRRIYKDVNELATAMMVTNIITVPVMKNQTRVDKQGKTRKLYGIIVNLKDYNVGADKGGAVNMFDDFDIDFNKYAYLIETRCSGSLIKPKSAIVLETVSE